MSRLVSVIVPVYNVENFLEQSIRSICNQTYKSLEIILVDDGSTDSSGDICDKYAALDNRIIVRHKVNGGQGSARNLGLDICKGDYITFLDSDDYMESSCIEVLISLLQKKNLDISACNYNFVTEDGKVIDKFTKSIGYLQFSGFDALQYMWNDKIINIAPWAKLFKRGLWERVRFKECYCEDSASMYLLYKEEIKIGFTDTELVNYVMRANSDVRSFSQKKICMLDIYEDVVKYAEENLPDFLQKASKSKAVAVNFHLLMQLPLEGYEKEKQRIYRTIKRFRKIVIIDTNARKKTRIACALSIIGFEFTCKVFEFMKKRNPAF